MIWKKIIEIHSNTRHGAANESVSVLSQNGIKSAFTLAEALITMVVIGIISALVLPDLIDQVDEYILKNQRKTAITKLSTGFEQMRLKGKLSGQYSSTNDFVEAMREDFKISKICTTDELNQCFVSSVKYATNDEKAPIITQHSLEEGLQKYEDMMSLQFQDGTSMLIAYKKDGEPIPEGDNYTGQIDKNSITGDIIAPQYCKKEDITVTDEQTGTTKTQTIRHECLFDYIIDVNRDGAPNQKGKDIVGNLSLFSCKDNNRNSFGYFDSCCEDYRKEHPDYWEVQNYGSCQEYCDADGRYWDEACYNNVEEYCNQSYNNCSSVCDEHCTGQGGFFDWEYCQCFSNLNDYCDSWSWSSYTDSRCPNYCDRGGGEMDYYNCPDQYCSWGEGSWNYWDGNPCWPNGPEKYCETSYNAQWDQYNCPKQYCQYIFEYERDYLSWYDTSMCAEYIDDEYLDWYCDYYGWYTDMCFEHNPQRSCQYSPWDHWDACQEILTPEEYCEATYYSDSSCYDVNPDAYCNSEGGYWDCIHCKDQYCAWGDGAYWYNEGDSCSCWESQDDFCHNSPNAPWASACPEQYCADGGEGKWYWDYYQSNKDRYSWAASYRGYAVDACGNRVCSWSGAENEYDICPTEFCNVHPNDNNCQ